MHFRCWKALRISIKAASLTEISSLKVRYPNYVLRIAIHPITNSSTHRHSPRSQRRHKIRRLRRRQSHRPPKQNPPTSQRSSCCARRPCPSQSSRKTEIHDRHTNVHVSRSHQRQQRRPPWRHRHLVPWLRHPRNEHWSPPLG